MYNFSDITILPGFDKNKEKENFNELSLNMGELYTIVGNTGSGKSRLIKDIEQLVNKDSISGRTVLINGKLPPAKKRLSLSENLIAHLGQNMRFVLDKNVEEFLILHAKCRNISNINISKVIETANEITPERIDSSMNLNTLSGGQSRALMIADISCICDSPIVLIDEIENAGIDKTKALKLLLNNGKLILIVTHDLHTALMSEKRIIMENGAIKAVLERSPAEKALFYSLEEDYILQQKRQNLLRTGERII